jgi:rod shape-determining protein MreD
MNRIKIWLPIAVVGGAAILQSTLLTRLTLYGASPDLSLVLLVFFANRTGSMKGQVAGFTGGLIEDFLSLSPLGFHALIKTIVGHLYGITRGKLFLDPVFIPLLLVSTATLLKHLLAGLTGAIFVSAWEITDLFGLKLWIEMGLNAGIAPFLFGFLKIFRTFRRVEQESYE